MATVTITTRPRKTGKSYIIQYLEPESGKKHHHATFRRKSLAMQEADKLRSLLDEGKLPKPRRNKKNELAQTFGSIASKCTQEWQRRHKEGDLSTATLKGYISFLKPLRKKWDKNVVGTISKGDLLEYRADVAVSRSMALANRQMFILKQVFAKAVECRAIQEDPTSGIKYLSEKVHERKQFMQPKKVEKLLKAAAKGRAKHYLPLAILLAVEHGLSKQEVLDLQWSDITLDYGETGIIRFYRTKTKVERVHRIMPRTRKALLARKAHINKMRKLRGIPHKGDYVVGHLDGSRMSEFKSAWRSVCKSLGIEDFHFHDNRHTYCSNIIMAGGTLKHAKEMIGHKTLRMADRYSHLEAARENVIQDNLAAHYEDPKAMVSRKRNT
ncbi:site-specific integrase [uncultured Pseudodesulfovibrio sp.]|uniref:site-specific integrase n=1 Tax=uncultured Pseudodesulfovibrio sp. TaxID=2035858 RepID=UPI0029C924C0|nr:site-specific integrase [uncultured Pseudodesulfovibrio sp.]